MFQFHGYLRYFKEGSVPGSFMDSNYEASMGHFTSCYGGSMFVTSMEIGMVTDAFVVIYVSTAFVRGNRHASCLIFFILTQASPWLSVDFAQPRPSSALCLRNQCGHQFRESVFRKWTLSVCDNSEGYTGLMHGLMGWGCGSRIHCDQHVGAIQQ